MQIICQYFKFRVISRIDKILLKQIVSKNIFSPQITVNLVTHYDIAQILVKILDCLVSNGKMKTYDKNFNKNTSFERYYHTPMHLGSLYLLSTESRINFKQIKRRIEKEFEDENLKVSDVEAYDLKNLFILFHSYYRNNFRYLSKKKKMNFLFPAYLPFEFDLDKIKSSNDLIKLDAIDDINTIQNYDNNTDLFYRLSKHF